MTELPDKLLSVVSLATTHLYTDIEALGDLIEKYQDIGIFVSYCLL